jgi:hypothetical protein
MHEKGIHGQLVDAVDVFCPRLLGLPLLRGRFRLRREPNDFLRKQVAGLKPGRAICLAEGEGRNAVHLARLGHKVIAQDLSATGLAKALALAFELQLSLQTLCSDLADWQPESGSVDLVVAIWMHLPQDLRAEVHRKAVSALKPGGTLILEAYTPRQLDLRTGGPPVVDLLIEPEMVALELKGLEFQLLKETRRWISEGPYHQGESAVVQAVGRKQPRKACQAT